MPLAILSIYPGPDVLRPTNKLSLRPNDKNVSYCHPDINIHTRYHSVVVVDVGTSYRLEIASVSQQYDMAYTYSILLQCFFISREDKCVHLLFSCDCHVLQTPRHNLLLLVCSIEGQIYLPLNVKYSRVATGHMSKTFEYAILMV